MNYTEYKTYFESILNGKITESPYNEESFLNYTKLNFARSARWEKHALTHNNLLTYLQQLTEPQHWIIITEPWCGDAAHSVPFLLKMAEASPMITYDLQLRDSEPFLIEQYLTNGSKSIPKLIVRDQKGNDLLVWGARPQAAQDLVDTLKSQQMDMDLVKIELQKWYNQNEGNAICEELNTLLRAAKQAH